LDVAEKSDHASRREISRGVVAIYKEYLGRGPTNSQTTISGDLVITVCSDGLTKAERKLASNGDEDTVRELRRKFQAAMETDIRHLVERVMGRDSRVFLSDHDVEQDIAIECVVLEVEEPV
jgi:uncharacterized protein YbcI